MSERKYQQRGYQEQDRERRPRDGQSRGPDGGARPERPPGAPAGARRISAEGARNPNMPGYHQVARCARCGFFVDGDILSRSKCPKCTQDLHACAQCVNFDPAARFQCTQPIPVRISPKDVANDCTLFLARTSWERDISSAQSAKPSEPSGAKKAFDDLFKF